MLNRKEHLLKLNVIPPLESGAVSGRRWKHPPINHSFIHKHSFILSISFCLLAFTAASDPTQSLDLIYRSKWCKVADPDVPSKSIQPWDVCAPPTHTHSPHFSVWFALMPRATFPCQLNMTVLRVLPLRGLTALVFYSSVGLSLRYGLSWEEPDESGVPNRAPPYCWVVDSLWACDDQYGKVCPDTMLEKAAVIRGLPDCSQNSIWINSLSKFPGWKMHILATLYTARTQRMFSLFYKNTSHSTKCFLWLLNEWLTVNKLKWLFNG